MDALDLVSRHEDELVRLMQDLIRIDTTNPPGNETAAANYLKGLFDKEGIPCEVLGPAEGRGSFLAYLKGSREGPRLLQFSHLDVVPATNLEAWKHPPFSGALEDGWIYGRGALDTKYLVAAEAMAMVLLKREGFDPKGELKMAAVADEEMGGTHGVKWLVENHPEKIRADYAINEGGGFAVRVGKKLAYLVEVEEKGICWVRARAKGVARHASIPYLGVNALAIMAEAISRISKYQAPKRPSANMREMAKVLFRELMGVKANVFSDAYIARLAKRDPELAATLKALMRITMAPTMVKGGVKENIVPDLCEAVIDCRFPYGAGKEDVLRELRKAVGKGVELDFEVFQYSEASGSPALTPFYRAMGDALKKVVREDFVLSPFVITGATDSRYLRPLGMVAYGFGPLSPKLDYRERIKLIHGLNERIDVESLKVCTAFLIELSKGVLR